jgi:hypothetical protein
MGPIQGRPERALKLCAADCRKTDTLPLMEPAEQGIMSGILFRNRGLTLEINK